MAQLLMVLVEQLLAVLNDVSDFSSAHTLNNILLPH